MNKSVLYAGLDVSKASLDFYFQGTFKKVDNNSRGHQNLISWIQKQNSTIHVVCEATGGYERALAHSLIQENISISVVQPGRVRQFAKASGILAKTDAIDARVIAGFAEIFKPQPMAPSHSSTLEMSELCTYRSQLQGKRVQISHQLEHVTLTLISKSLKKLLRSLDHEIEKLDEQIDALMKSHSSLKEKFDRIIQIQGVGRQTALTVLAFFPEIGQLSKRQTAALAGLAPYNNDSGSHRGSRSIKGGRRKLRAALYMAALTASRRNPILSSFYQRLIAKGKKPKVALTALMRKLIVLLNAIIKNPNLSLAT
jgi:transposase